MTTISFVQHLSVRNAIIYYINGQTIFGDKKKIWFNLFYCNEYRTNEIVAIISTRFVKFSFDEKLNRYVDLNNVDETDERSIHFCTDKGFIHSLI